MVVFFTSNVVSPPCSVYMGKDKVENEDLIRYGTDLDVWFHVDKLSSAHVYLRLPASLPYGGWDALPEKLLVDMGQLVKANSIEGNKKNNVTIIYTPHSNLKKTGDMATGAVSFHNDKLVKRVYIPTRDNAVVNRLNKTKVVREVDHEAERIERQRREGKTKKALANDLKNEKLELMRKREQEKNSRGYDALFTEENGYATKEAKARARAAARGSDEESEGEEGKNGDDDDDFW